MGEPLCAMLRQWFFAATSFLDHVSKMTLSASPIDLYHSIEGQLAVRRHYAEMLQRYPIPYTSAYLPTRYGQTHVIISGRPDAPPLLLLHGHALNAMTWNPNVAALAEHFQVYAVDTIGDTGHSAPTRPSLLDASYAHWLIDVLNALALHEVRVAAMSMGGWIALQAALHYPERIQQMALIAPVGFATLRTSVMTQGLFGLIASGTDFSIANLLSKLCRRTDPEMGELIYLIARHHRAKIIPPLPIFTTAELEQITTPVHLMIGDHDEMFAPESLLKRANRLGGPLSWQLVPHAGHGVTITHTTTVNAFLLSALLTTR